VTSRIVLSPSPLPRSAGAYVSTKDTQNLQTDRKRIRVVRFSGKEEGFTLIEVLAALTVLALTFVVLLETDGLNASRTLHAERTMGAVQLAGEKMEEVFASGSEGLFSDGGEQDDGIYSWERTISDTEFAGLKEVRLTVKWNEGNREENYVARAYLPQ
jgi:prepilin-type N-terminal cleavage/methylation domain-containing protein